jgi:hypothetical protein
MTHTQQTKNKNMQKKTAKEVVLETIEYYENNPERRAVNKTGLCMYHDKDTDNMCAVGRCMIDPKQNYDCGVVGLHKNNIEIEEENVFKEMKEEYSNIAINVWQHLQSFHDLPSYWNENGLTQTGKEYKEILINKYCKN